MIGLFQIKKHRISEIKGSFYVITVMDAFSRAISPATFDLRQDLACALIVLYVAIEQFGAPLSVLPASDTAPPDPPIVLSG